MKRTHEDAENSRHFQKGHPSESHPVQQNLQVKGVTRPAGRQQRPEQYDCQSSCSRSSAFAPLPSAGNTSAQQQPIHAPRNISLLPQSGVANHAPWPAFGTGPQTTSSATGLGIPANSCRWPQPHAACNMQHAVWNGQSPSVAHPGDVTRKDLNVAHTLTTQDARTSCNSPPSNQRCLQQHPEHQQQQQHPSHRRPRSPSPSNQAGLQPVRPLQQRRILPPQQTHVNAQQRSDFQQRSCQAPQTGQVSGAPTSYNTHTTTVTTTPSSVPQPYMPHAAMPVLFSAPAPAQVPIHAPPTGIPPMPGCFQAQAEQPKARPSTAPLHPRPSAQEPSVQPTALCSDYSGQPFGSVLNPLQAQPSHQDQLPTAWHGIGQSKQGGADTRLTRPPQAPLHCHPNGSDHFPKTCPGPVGQLRSDSANRFLSTAVSHRQPSAASPGLQHQQHHQQQGSIGPCSATEPCTVLPASTASVRALLSLLPERTATEGQTAPLATHIAVGANEPTPPVQPGLPVQAPSGGPEAHSHAARECAARNTHDECAKRDAAVAPSCVGMPPVEKLKRPLRLKLSQWIPHGGVTAAFEAKGVTSLYPWQAAALECGEDGSNLVYCAPTSGGKSLVAEVLLIRRLVDALARRNREQQRRGDRPQHPPPAPPRALLVLPYVSIVSEKTEHLTQVLAPLRLRVRGYTGAEQGGAPLAVPDEAVAVVTMEKANSTVNRLIAEGRLDELCCVVVDEAHMVGDPQRGICLELCLTKLRFTAAATAAQSPSRSPKAAKGPIAPSATAVPTTTEAGASDGGSVVLPNPPTFSCQLVCMSATMSGLDDLCGWLDARLFMTNYRPVPLTEHVVFQGKVFRKLAQREVREQQAAAEQGARQGPGPQQQQRGQEPHGSGGADGAPGVSLTDPTATSDSTIVTDKPVGGASAFTTAAALASAGASTARPSGGAGSGSRGGDARGVVAGKSTGDGAAAGVVSLDPLVEERDLPISDPRDPDRLVPLVVEVAAQGHSTLVFCATRNACQGCAGLLAELLPKELGPANSETLEGRRKLLNDLQDASGGYLSPELEKLIEAGVAYHHAGLTSQERSAVERGFRTGLIHTLTATSTLAAGINLPARRVILRSLRQGIGPVSRAQYLQMIGRAGRAGQSPIGEAFLIGRGAAHSLQSEWREVCRLLTAPLPPLRCCLLDSLLPAADEEREGATGARAGSDPGAVAGLQGAAPRGAAKGAQNAAGAAEVKGETHLQRMLLEAIANGSVATGANVEALIRSTLLYQQAGYDVIAAATHSALTALRNRRLVTYSAPSQPVPQPSSGATSTTSAPAAAGGGGLGVQGQRTTTIPTRKSPASSAPGLADGGAGGGTGAQWQPTQMGRAIYDSCLPTSTGEALYARLLRAQDGLALAGGLHLLALLLEEPLPVEIGNWEMWAGWLERMPREPHLRVAEALGVTLAYAKRLAGGRRGQLADSARHSRFASACLMHNVLCEGDLHELEVVWGAPGALTKNGITRGVLQKVQADLSKWAGMAAVMAGSCGWWALQGLLEALSQQAAAGARPELLPLMALPNMTGARARGLYAAGFTKPSQLAVAAEEDVKKALASSLPRMLRHPKPVKGSTESAIAAAATATSGNALVARGARALVESARKYMAEMAARLAAAEKEADASLGDLEAARRLAQELRAARSVGLADSGTDGYGDSKAGVVVSPEGGSPAASSSSAAVTTLRGSARVREISDASSKEKIETFLQAWRSQPTFAVAVISSRPLALEPELRAQQLQQLSIVGPGAGAGVGPNSTSNSMGVDPSGARPSPLNTTMMVPGPPPAAITSAQASRSVPPLGSQSTAAAPVQNAPSSSGRVSSAGAEMGASAIEGLVVVWSHIDVVVLTFNHSGDGTAKAAGSGKQGAARVGAEVEHMQVGGPGGGPAGGGRKRKADKELGPSGAAKLRGAAPAVAARAGAAGAAPGVGGNGCRDGGFDSAGGADHGALDQSPEVGAVGGSRSKLWHAAREILGAAGSSKVAWHAEAQVAALLAAGCEPAGQWDDPRVMAWLALGTAGPQDILLAELQRSVLPSYAVRVPLQHRAAVTAACRTALSAWALVGPLRGMLAAEGVATHYRMVEAPLTLALARTRLNFAGPVPPPPAPTPAVSAAEDHRAPHSALHIPADTTGRATTTTSTSPVPDPAPASPSAAATAPLHSLNPPPQGSTSSTRLRRPTAAGHLFLREAVCRQQLAALTANRQACERLVSSIVDRPMNLSQPTAVEALCGREYIVRRAGQLSPHMQALWPFIRRPPRFAAFYSKAGLPPRVQARAQVLAMLLTRSAAVECEAASLAGLLNAAAAVPVADSIPVGAGQRPLLTSGPHTEAADATREEGGNSSTTAPGGAAVAAEAAHESGDPACNGGVGSGVYNVGMGSADLRAGGGGGAAARFAIQRLGVEGRLGCVFGEEGSGGSGSGGGPEEAAVDGWLVVTELSRALVSAPSVQQQYYNNAEGMRRLQSLLPLPVFFLGCSLDPAADTGLPPPPHPGSGALLRSGWLLELQGPSPRMALQFGSEAPQEDGQAADRSSMALVALTDPLTRQPLRLLLPATHVWCEASCCGQEQRTGAHQAGQLLGMVTTQVFRCPAEELLQPPPGWVFMTVLYPYLHLAVAAHCCGDERLVEALYQPDPWAALAAVWTERQASQLRRLLRLPPDPNPTTTTATASLSTCVPLELMARGVLCRGLMDGCSHGELASALRLGAQGGGPQGESGGKMVAAALVASFLEAFPGVALHREELMMKAKKDGYVMTPGGQRLRPATRSLNAGGVAATPKLQRLLSRLQMGGAVSEVVRTCAVLCMHRTDELLAQYHTTRREQQQQQSPRPPHHSPPQRRGRQEATVTAQAAVKIVEKEAAAAVGMDLDSAVAAVKLEPTGAAAQLCPPPPPPPRASLVWCNEGQVTLCVPDGRLTELMAAAQEAAGGGVMAQLGLRVPLHVSIYHGRRLRLELCEQYAPGDV